MGNKIKLRFVERLDVRNETAGPTDPSGLTVSRDGKALWTVSDDTMTVFQLDLKGKLVDGASFAVGQAGFEGITLNETGRFLYVVQEDGNVLAKYSLRTKSPVLSRRLSNLDGFDQIGDYFSADADNKGLEGITINTHTGNLFLLKEGQPGLLLEITPDLTQLVAHRRLTKKRGFRDSKLDPQEIDYSGISYDPTRDAFWIVSDKAKRVYLHSWAGDTVLFAKALKYAADGRKKKKEKIKKAEGVAYDGVNDRLYIVSDEDARLYVYDIR
jgi:uncharacterized protein YjiK